MELAIAVMNFTIAFPVRCLFCIPAATTGGKLVGNTKGTGRDFSKGLFLGAEDSGAAGQTLELLACGMSCRIYRASNKQIRRT